MNEITQCFIASEPVSMNVFNRFTQLIKENDELKARFKNWKSTANLYQSNIEKENAELMTKYKKQEKAHQAVMSHWMTTNKKMLYKANKHFSGVEKENDELKANWESLKTELKNAAKLDVLFGEEDEVAKVSVVATLNIMSKLEGGKR